MESNQPDSQPHNEVDNGSNVTTEQMVQENSPDLSVYFRDGEPGVFDPDKIAGLAKDLENQKKSTSYFQSQFMKKNSVPEAYEDYYKTFKADSVYEAAMTRENVKNSLDDIFKWCHENKFGQRESNLLADYILKNAVASNVIDMRSESDLEAEKQAFYNQELEKVKPMLESLNRTVEENNEIIENFLDSPSVFTNNPEMKEYLQELANTDARGYKLVTVLTQAIEHRGIPVVTGTSTGAKDRVAFDREYQSESDPIKREALLKAFLGEA